VVAETQEEALKQAIAKTGNPDLKLTDLRQDEDVLDTWFSSWLWPISVFDGIRFPDNADIKYYYPTDVLITAPEILFFWVARMIISGYEYLGKEPFKNVYLTGIVRDKMHRKMSKSLGNSPEPLDLITKYSADGVRIGMLFSSPAGNDLLYDEALSEQGRNFGNKIWNAFRLLKGWQVDGSILQPEYAKVSILWFENQLNKSLTEIEEQFNTFRISEALMTVYKLFWDEFSAWYLEMIKPEYLKPIDKFTFEATINFFDKLLKILHPFMPFITEEIWQLMEQRKDGESIMVATMPKSGTIDEKLIYSFDQLKETITQIRNIRKDKGIANKDKVSLFVNTANDSFDNQFEPVLIKMANLDKVSQTKDKVSNAESFMVLSTEFYVVTGVELDIEAEINKISEELEYTKGFLFSVMKKLNNERFVSSAPEEVVAMERKKQADAEAKIKALQERLKELKK
jgi:valyl-tRNA synthetase